MLKLIGANNDISNQLQKKTRLVRMKWSGGNIKEVSICINCLNVRNNFFQIMEFFPLIIVFKIC